MREAQLIGFFLNRILELEVIQRISVLDRIWTRIYFIYKFYFERQLVNWVRNNPDQLATVIDVGAGFGFYSWTIANTSEKSFIYAFEPDIRNFKRSTFALSRVRNLNRIEIHNLAVTEKNSTMFLQRDLYNPANHKVSTEINSGIAVRGITLDDFCKEKDIAPTFIKIDVQGHEEQVLRGATRVISEFHPIILMEFELNPKSKNAENCWSTMKTLGYEAFELSRSGKTIKVNTLPNRKTYFDLVFISAESQSSLQL
jgi:FkbM family methyltransferase